MRIGFDASCWANGRGYGRFTRGLLQALLVENGARNHPHEFVLVLDRASAACADLPSGVERSVAKTNEAAVQAASSAGRRSMGDLWAMRRAATQARLDLLIYPTVYTYFPPPARVPTLVTIHDTIAERFPRLVFPNRRLEVFWRLKVLAAAWRAALILTVSDAAAGDIHRYLRVAQRRIRVVSEGVEDRFQRVPSPEQITSVAARFGLNPEAAFLLYVGGLSPHKNIDALIEAVARLKRDPGLASLRLVLAGDYSRDSFFSAHAALRELVAARELGDAVIFTGFVTDEELAALYKSATALVFPSLIEGFGLPAVEAMACGTPVVASAAGSLPEVVGDTGLFFDPGKPQSLDAALRRVLTDSTLRADLARRGPQRAALFNWPRTATLTLAACEEAARKMNQSSRNGRLP